MRIVRALSTALNTFVAGQTFLGHIKVNGIEMRPHTELQDDGRTRHGLQHRIDGEWVWVAFSDH